MSYGTFESVFTDGTEHEAAKRSADKALQAAVFDAREQFGAFLAGATDKQDFEDRVALVKPQMRDVVAAHLMPVTGVMRKVVRACRPDFNNRTAGSDWYDSRAIDGDSRLVNEVKVGDVLHDSAFNTDQTVKAITTVPGGKRFDVEDESGGLGTIMLKTSTSRRRQAGIDDAPELIPEGDFEGYLDDVDQNAPSRVTEHNFSDGAEDNFTGKPEGNFASRKQAAGNLIGWWDQETGAVWVEDPHSGNFDRTVARLEPAFSQIEVYDQFGEAGFMRWDNLHPNPAPLYTCSLSEPGNVVGSRKEARTTLKQAMRKGAPFADYADFDAFRTHIDKSPTVSDRAYLSNLQWPHHAASRSEGAAGSDLRGVSSNAASVSEAQSGGSSAAHRQGAGSRQGGPEAPCGIWATASVEDQAGGDRLTGRLVRALRYIESLGPLGKSPAWFWTATDWSGSGPQVVANRAGLTGATQALRLALLELPTAVRVSDRQNLVADIGDILRSEGVAGQVVHAILKGAPFADYADWDACIAANKGKVDDVEAYCGKIKHQVEDSKKGSRKKTADTQQELERLFTDAGWEPITGEHLDWVSPDEQYEFYWNFGNNEMRYDAGDGDLATLWTATDAEVVDMVRQQLGWGQKPYEHAPGTWIPPFDSGGWGD